MIVIFLLEFGQDTQSKSITELILWFIRKPSNGILYLFVYKIPRVI